MDTEHWFAPMASKQGNNLFECGLFLSTNRTDNVKVEIYNNNTLYQTLTISKGSPGIVDIPSNLILATSRSESMVKNTKGLYVKASQKIFANLRFSVQSHGEIVTSKGLAGLGNTFFATMAPNTTAQQITQSGSGNNINSMVSVIATEDFTTIKFSNYNPNVKFADGSQSATKQINLMRGESYILEAVGIDDPTNNLTGLIGTKIESDKSISVTNGNFNGIYTNNFTSSDILMDQTVPIERLGKSFAITKGNGSQTNGMEQLLIVATEDGTTIKVNGTDIPGTLNAGNYKLIDGSNYINQGNQVYNMGIETSKNVYVYQLLGGTSSGSVYASGGMNFIPALSCFLPNSIDEIAEVNHMPYYDRSVVFDTKLNIITQKGANVAINGTAIPAYSGPYPVNGNSEWETYSITNVTGNLTITSTKSVTAGIAAGNGAVGYGGYFAGFSSVPVITKSGDCFNGVKLEVDNTYDSYQWYLNNVAIPGETTYFIDPEKYGNGSYTVNITKTNCDTKLTLPYSYMLCPPVITKDFTIGSCKTEVEIPAFTIPTSQSIVASKTKIIVQPKNGTFSINQTTGAITYTPNTTLTSDATDTFVYMIEGNGTPVDFQYFRININIDYLVSKNVEIIACSDLSGFGHFNLNDAAISDETNITSKYFFENKTDAQNLVYSNAITSPTNYYSKAKTVYALLTNSYGCTAIAEVKLSMPNLDTFLYNSEFCDENLDGSVTVKLSDITPLIIKDAGLYTVIYSLANNPTVPLPDNFTFSGNTKVQVEVRSGSICPPIIGFIDFKIKNQISLNSVNAIELCDNERDGKTDINLKDYETLFTGNATATYYDTLQNAKNKTGSITPNQTINGNKTYYYRFENSTDCPAVGSLDFIFKQPNVSTVLADKIICKEATTTLDAGTGFTAYKWSTGDTTQSVSNLGVGDYYVDLTSNGCTYRQSVKITASEIPSITSIYVEGSTVTIIANGGTAPYSYSIDGVKWQNENVFTNVSRGKHTAYLRDKYNCTPVTSEFLIINLLNVITPNDDGYNDVLDYSDLKIYSNVSIQVFDRYGNAVYQSNNSNYIWDGKINGRPVPTATYWYAIKWTEADKGLEKLYKGWIMVKNR